MYVKHFIIIVMITISEGNSGFLTIKPTCLKPLAKAFLRENRIPLLLAEFSLSQVFFFFPSSSLAPQNEHLAESLARMQNGSQGEGAPSQDL